MIFKCKVCGGDLDIQEKASIGECQYCGTKQTLPRLDDEKRANLYERANHFRRQNEFDKAANIYETILNEDKSDSEAYWSLVLCKYGVEYVEDPATRTRVPTCNRSQYASVLADADYKKALAHADVDQRLLYEDEAKIIDGIQKGFLEISSKEEPFDIFICYKESDESGRRTPDSVLAQEMYHQLTAEGFKVFFSRITLEDTLGSAYEPYIFAALQSSRVMVVVGTKVDYFNAVWVKNEWSRYLALVKGGAKKILIPAYRDIDPYMLPEDFSHLQSQDMSKLGFMQDLVRGIKKILTPARSTQSDANPPQLPAAGTAVPSTQSLLQRAFIELEDGNWQKADSLLEQVLNADPQNAKAYTGKLMATLGISCEENLAEADSSLIESSNYQKAVRFANDEYKAVLQGYSDAVEEKLETLRKQGIYEKAVDAAKKMRSVTKNSSAIAAEAAECRQIAELFKSISGFWNSDEWAAEMETRASNAQKLSAEELKREKRKRLAKKLVKFGIVASIILFVSFKTVIIPAKEKAAAEKVHKIENAKLAEAKKQKDAKLAEEKKRVAAIQAEAKKLQAEKEKIIAAKYPVAEALLAAGKYAEAKVAFNEIGGYKFGSYTWRILDIDGSNALLITENIVAEKRFNEKDINVSWENSTLRKYLNSDFYSKFSARERSKIVSTKVSNPKYGNMGGKTTSDKIFLLSIEEASTYFKDFPKDKIRQFGSQEAADKYYKENGDRVAVTNDGSRHGWWLRTPGGTLQGVAVTHDFAATVDGFRGDIESKGVFVDQELGVRPALWISLKP